MTYMPTAKELLEYSNCLKEAVLKNSTEVYFNDSILHAMIIMKELFNKAAKEEQKKVCIYCGEFSLFRDETKIKVDNEKIKCSLDGLDEKEHVRWNELNFYKDLRESFKSFLKESNACLELIIQTGLETIRNQSIWNELRREDLMKKVKVYVPTFDLGLDHFATSTEAYRVEISDAVKTATCCFNDKENARVLNDCFHSLMKYSTPFDM